MTFTIEQIKALENPYQELGDADTLAEHRQLLEQDLSAQEKKDLAIKLVLQCPEKELNGLGHAIKALKAHGAAEDTFQHAVNKVWQLRKKIVSLSDPRNKNPHLLFIAPDFSDELREESTIALQLLAGKEKDIAQKLALATPATQRHTVARNAQNALHGSDFATTVGAAFTLRREIELLLGDEPYKFFISAEFNAPVYLQFLEILALIEDKDEEITAMLANTPANKRHLVLDKMNTIFPGSTFVNAVKNLLKSSEQASVHQQSFFAPAPAAPQDAVQASTSRPGIPG